MKTPINSGLAQSNVDFNNFKASNADLSDYSGQGLDWNAATKKFDVTSVTSSLVTVNIKDPPYNAAGDGVTDDTAAIQSAIDDLGAAFGGTIFFPAGKYIIGGALQATGTANAQLLLPDVGYGDGTTVSIRFLGETPPSPQIFYLGTVGTPDHNCATLVSTLSFGNGAMIGGYGTSVAFPGHFTDIQFAMHNIECRMPDDPTNSCLDFSRVAGVDLRDVLVNTGQYEIDLASEPTTSSSYGIKMPGNNNGSPTMDRVWVTCFYNGILSGELIDASRVETIRCKVGVEFPFVYHSSCWRHLTVIGCARGLKWTGAHPLRILMLDMEKTTTGWATLVYDIDDASNLGIGEITYLNVTPFTGVYAPLSVNGGANLMLRNLNAL